MSKSNRRYDDAMAMLRLFVQCGNIYRNKVPNFNRQHFLSPLGFSISSDAINTIIK